ncbi:MAG: CHAT domain-containing protein [Burkholderiales bacterium]|nr:CHAT domain-containing protein [Burkholderiales bacterium]
MLRVLETYKPDPAKVERLRSIAKQEPSTALAGNALAEFYLGRGRAAWDLGQSAQATADLRKAIDELKWGQPLRLRALSELRNVHWTGGNVSGALAAAQQTIRETGNRPYYGYRIGARTLAADARASIGDFAEARSELAAAEAEYALGMSVLFNWKPWQRLLEDRDRHFSYRWTSHMEAARATLFESEGEWTKAEATLRRSLDAAQQLKSVYLVQGWLGAPRVELDQILIESKQSRLAYVLANRGHFAEAEIFGREAVRSALERAGRFDPYTGAALQHLSKVLSEQGRWAEARLIAREAVRSVEGSGAVEESRALGDARRSLVAALVAAGEYEEAVQVFERYRAGVQRDKFLASQLEMGDIDWVIAHVKSGRLAGARQLIEAMGVWSRSRLEEGDERVAWIRGYLGVVLAAQGERERALVELRAAVPALIELHRAMVSADAGSVRKAQRLAIVFETYIDLLYDLTAAGTSRPEFDPIGESFAVADVARGSSVQRALSAASTRASAHDSALAELARREQDTRWRIESLSEILLRLVAAPPDRQLPKIVGELRRDIDALTKTQGELRRELASRFPDYAQLIDPKPPTLEQARSALREGETLLAFYVGERGTYIWAVPKAGPARFVRVPVGAAELGRDVARLRAALDVQASAVEDLPTFELGLAARLYGELLRPVEAVWKEAPNLLVVTHGPLGQLPLGLLVLEAPAAATQPEAVQFEGYRAARWLAREATIAQLASVNTLTSLRKLPLLTASNRAFVGFGDPIFSKADSGGGPAPAMRGTVLARRDAPELAKLDSAQLAALPRLPDTGEEVREVAKALGADPARDVFLREAASEKTLNSLNLAEPRIIAFATHGLVPGDLNGLTQPALALSSPEVTGDDGDGLLTMEEVLGLKLNADWVVLSACNTAAGAGAGAEAVSGLGRAFFYAGARALLVSNWPVETRSARVLMVDTFSRYAKDGSKRKSAALREAMLAMIDGEGYVDPSTGKPVYRYAHPLFWAPFVVVGD